MGVTVPIVTGFFSGLNEIMQESAWYQEALKWQLLLPTLIKNIHDKYQFCVVWGQEYQVHSGTWAALGSQRSPGLGH